MWLIFKKVKEGVCLQVAFYMIGLSCTVSAFPISHVCSSLWCVKSGQKLVILNFILRANMVHSLFTYFVFLNILKETIAWVQ